MLRVSKSQKTVEEALDAAVLGASIEDGTAKKRRPVRLEEGAAKAFFSGIEGLTPGTPVDSSDTFDTGLGAQAS